MADKCYSTDEEVYNHDNLAEAVESIICYDDDIKVGDIVSVWEGKSVSKSASDFCYFDSSDLGEQAYDNAGDFAEGWPSSNKEQEQELLSMVKAAVDAWADKHDLHPNFYGVKDTKEVKVKVLPNNEFELIGK